MDRQRIIDVLTNKVVVGTRPNGPGRNFVRCHKCRSVVPAWRLLKTAKERAEIPALERLHARIQSLIVESFDYRKISSWVSVAAIILSALIGTFVRVNLNGCKRCGSRDVQPAMIGFRRGAWWYFVRGILVRKIIMRKSNYDPRIPSRQAHGA